MAVKVKCPVCGCERDKEDAVQVRRRYCCPEHAEEYRRAEKPKSSPKPEMPGYAELIALICDYFEIKAPTGLILKQVQTFRQAYEFTYDGMRATLMYCAKWATPPVEMDVDRGIAFIPYRYQEARKFYEQIGELSRYTEKVDLETVLKNKRIVNINAEDLYADRHRIIGLMDIGSMVED